MSLPQIRVPHCAMHKISADMQGHPSGLSQQSTLALAGSLMLTAEPPPVPLIRPDGIIMMMSIIQSII